MLLLTSFLFFSLFLVVHVSEQKYCGKCSKWYDKEISDTNWLEKLNRDFKCPCEAKLVDSFWGKHVKEVDNPSSKEWKPDKSCRNPESSGCQNYHPGAAGCIRSAGKTSDGARQQCCYGSDGKLLKPGTKSAGTPDKKSGLFSHYIHDVIPYENCCEKCKIAGYCEYYINGVRRGDDSHC